MTTLIFKGQGMEEERRGREVIECDATKEKGS